MLLCRYAGIMKCTGFEKSGGKVTEVRGEFRPLQAGEKPPKVNTPLQLGALPVIAPAFIAKH